MAMKFLTVPLFWQSV